MKVEISIGPIVSRKNVHLLISTERCVENDWLRVLHVVYLQRHNEMATFLAHICLHQLAVHSLRLYT